MKTKLEPVLRDFEELFEQLPQEGRFWLISNAYKMFGKAAADFPLAKRSSKPRSKIVSIQQGGPRE